MRKKLEKMFVITGMIASLCCSGNSLLCSSVYASDTTSESVADSTAESTFTEAEIIENAEILFEKACEASQQGYDQFAELFCDTDEDTINKRFEMYSTYGEVIGSLDEMIPTVIMDDFPYYNVNLYFFDYYDEEKKNINENVKMGFLVRMSYIDNEWKLDEGEAYEEREDDLPLDYLYPQGLVESLFNDRNYMTFNNDNYMYLDYKSVFPGCQEWQAKYMYQREDGSVVIGIWFSNGSDEDFEVQGIGIQAEDQSLGTIIDINNGGECWVGRTIAPGYSDIAEVEIPAEYVLTGTQEWTSIDFPFFDLTFYNSSDEE